MRKTFIQETALWYIIKRIYEAEDWVATIKLYRNWKEREDHEKYARVYFFKEDALSELMIIKIWKKSEQW